MSHPISPTGTYADAPEISCVSCGENSSAAPAVNHTNVREPTADEMDELKSSPMAFFLGYGIEPLRLSVPRG